MAAATSLNIIDNHRMNDTGHGNGLTITAGSVRVCLQALAWAANGRHAIYQYGTQNR